jgi:hypothetical protein
VVRQADAKGDHRQSADWDRITPSPIASSKSSTYPAAGPPD